MDLQELANNASSEGETTGSMAVRRRVQLNKTRHLAADNIAECVTERDIASIEKEIEPLVQGILNALIVDTENDPNSLETPARHARMLVREVCQGRFAPRPDLKRFPSSQLQGTLNVVGPIKVRSTCSHHLVPILGQAWIGVIPGEWYLGLSKFHRLTQWVMSRLQIQEEATELLASEIEYAVQPQGCAIVVEAEHLCCTWRGVKDQSSMKTMALRGQLLTDLTVRSEFMSLVNAR